MLSSSFNVRISLSVAQNLENIIQTQIHNIRTGGASSPASASCEEQNQRSSSSCSSVETEQQQQQLINSNAQVKAMSVVVLISLGTPSVCWFHTKFIKIFYVASDNVNKKSNLSSNFLLNYKCLTLRVRESDVIPLLTNYCSPGCPDDPPDGPEPDGRRADVGVGPAGRPGGAGEPRLQREDGPGPVLRPGPRPQ